jgi:hypothetical protein
MIEPEFHSKIRKIVSAFFWFIGGGILIANIGCFISTGHLYKGIEFAIFNLIYFIWLWYFVKTKMFFKWNKKYNGKLSVYLMMVGCTMSILIQLLSNAI